jgi:PIN domain nuclease of toxin-antitoxin system
MAASKLLLDTHALLWWANGDRSLSMNVRRLIEDDSTHVVVSSATAWEISTKVRLGKLQWGNTSIEAYCVSQRFDLLPVSFAHAERAGSWPQPHGDPFDRMLAAQSAIDKLPLATNDQAISAFGIETIW